MEKAYTIGLLLCLSVVFVQDYKNRMIHLTLPILIFALSLLMAAGLDEIFLKIIVNISFFLIIVSVLTLYMSIKAGRFLNPFRNYFGFGDLLFFIAVTPLFRLNGFIIYFTMAMLFAIVLQLALKRMMKHDTVPLAGFASVLLILLIAEHVFLHHFTIIKLQ
ncbi:hypothetical protein [Flavobacterium sp. 3HN19-14]|uniref:hypothetical protein n=1 Tax=Flavobacterium sp. 3HN19-14 TaxID=3448133 RepID=UPI003EE30080